MKQFNNLLSRRAAAVISAIVLAIFLGGATARAQSGTLTPIVECVETSEDGLSRIYYGYRNTNSQPYFLSVGANNYLSPGQPNQGQPTFFSVGSYRTVFYTDIYFTEDIPSLTWTLNGNSVSASANSAPCQKESEITFQGRLSAGNAAATGNYDLRFQLFDAATGGNADGAIVSLPNVPVTNGVFTVKLDFGETVLQTPRQHYLEISVRAAGAGTYTTLTPRQALTIVPSAAFAFKSVFAANAQQANNAYQATNALTFNNKSVTDFLLNSTAPQTANFNISGGGTLGGDLTATKGIFSGDLTANKTTSNGFLARGGAPGAYGSNNNGFAFRGDTGDEDGGLFSLANGQINIFTNSGERVRVTDGGLQVFGTLTANTKNFKIDDPRDPANKTLTYTSVESPDMMNIYNGNVTTDESGEAVVKMPDYFEALNRDFRYQLTVIGTFAQAIISEKIKGNSFKIKTDKPNVEVSWQVTGVRKDKFAEDNRPKVEQEKSLNERGRCIYAPACGNSKP